MQGWGSSTYRVCLCVCYRSSGRSGYLMSQKKVPYMWLFWRALNLANWSENVIGEYKFGEYSNIDSVRVRVRSSRHLKVKYLREMSCCTSVAILSSILAYLCSLLGCVGVVLQTYGLVVAGFFAKAVHTLSFTDVEDGTRDDCLKYLCKEYIFLVIRSSCWRYSTVRDLESWQNKSSHVRTWLLDTSLVRDWRTLIQYNHFDEL